MQVRCVVACMGCNGPALVPVIVECDQGQYDEGDHYEAAKDQASEDGYDGPMVVFDENDGPAFLFGHFVWGAAPVVYA